MDRTFSQTVKVLLRPECSLLPREQKRQLMDLASTNVATVTQEKSEIKKKEKVEKKGPEKSRRAYTSERRLGGLWCGSPFLQGRDRSSCSKGRGESFPGFRLLTAQALNHCQASTEKDLLCLGLQRQAGAARRPRLQYLCWVLSEATGALLVSSARGDLLLAGLDSSGSCDS